MLKFDPKPLYEFTIVSNGMDYRIQAENFCTMIEGDEPILHLYKGNREIACFREWDCIFEDECEDIIPS